MKMRTVIEAGREASPLVNEGLAEMRTKVDSFRQLLSDLSSIKCDAARNAIILECVRAMDSMSGTLADATSKWNAFDSALRSYKYRPKRVKITASRDLPGQQVLFDDPACPVTQRAETGIP